MAIFNSKLLNYQRVFSAVHKASPWYPMVIWNQWCNVCLLA